MLPPTNCVVLFYTLSHTNQTVLLGRGWFTGDNFIIGKFSLPKAQGLVEIYGWSSVSDGYGSFVEVFPLVKDEF